jgi:hypothetical protein
MEGEAGAVIIRYESDVKVGGIGSTNCYACSANSRKIMALHLDMLRIASLLNTLDITRGVVQ